MADILDAAQSKTQPPSGTTPPSDVTATPVPAQPMEPAPVPPASPISSPEEPEASSEPLATSSDSLIIPPPEEPSPTSPSLPPVPPPTEKPKKKSRMGVLIAGLLLLVITLPVLVVFVRQQVEIRSRATETVYPFITCCPKYNTAYSINTCTGASENACKININYCTPSYTTSLCSGITGTKPGTIPPSLSCDQLKQQVAAGSLIPDNPSCGSCNGGQWCGTWVAEIGIPKIAGITDSYAQGCGLWVGRDHFLIPSTGKTLEGCFPEPSCPGKAAISCTTTPAATPTPTPTTPGQCIRIKAYKGTTLLTANDFSNLQPGDTITLALVPSGPATKAHFRINSSSTSDWHETTMKNGQNEFIWDWTVPSGVTSFNVEGESFDGSAWH